MTGELAGKAAVATGAGGDIGRAITAALVGAGARVAALDLVAPDFDDPAVLPLACDVADAGAVEAAVARAGEAFGRLDILVNNAAAPTPLGDVTQIAPADWARSLEVNLTGAYLMCRSVVPWFRRGGGGVILNIASQLGHVATPGRAVYSASKAGLISLTRTLALDHAAENIRAVSLSPGAVMTGRVIAQAGSAEAAEAALAPLHPLGRLGSAEEIAAAALFLVGPGAAFVTGTDLLADGGYTAR
ncbi:SDR family oxidoreductase [Albimonas sp. CAU 1670]|uniref:SDR family NAD(P)-dependent oxidoreductase n=1 Tax=Albimonas sp. CAU 1670 TaxID=3032599 RepID=UPI0023DBD494|nr:SDR family oxidoreductase [Albimonas sp. CAU 1670]MDF2232376.1 SDR family oxidoreductase [Albimonas sp. CAU 1670]